MLGKKFPNKKLLLVLILLNFYFFNSDYLHTYAIPHQAGGSVFVVYANPSLINIDGIISPNEYPSHYKDPITDIEAYFVHNGTDLFVGLISIGTGWVSIAFGPQGIGMDGANIYIGYVQGETTVWEDHYGIGLSHSEDIELSGGTTDIGEFKGTENSSNTIIEFSCPLSSGDEYDHKFTAGGTFGFLLAHHPIADDTTSYHPEKSDYLLITLESSALLLPLQFNPLVEVDGIITQNEYEMSFFDPITEIEVHMQHNSTDLFIGLVSPSEGWVGIGFGLSGIGMNGSNIIIGYVTNSSSLTIADFYGVPDFHFNDVSDGGTNDLKDSAGVEDISKTVIEFIYPLTTEDLIHDHNFTLWGTYGFFLSRSPADDFITMHPVHSPTYDFTIIGEKVTPFITISAKDSEGNNISDNSQVLKGSSIILNAKLAISGEECDCLIGIAVNLYINSTFGKLKENSGFTNRNSSISFSYNFSQVKGRIDFIIELPETAVAWQLLSLSQKSFSVEVMDPAKEELRFIDDAKLGGLIGLAILTAVGIVMLTYALVLLNTSRISKWRNR